MMFNSGKLKSKINPRNDSGIIISNQSFGCLNVYFLVTGMLIEVLQHPRKNIERRILFKLIQDSNQTFLKIILFYFGFLRKLEFLKYHHLVVPYSF